MLPNNTKWVVIDEVQKIPKLLDAVHRQMEAKGLLFALTGSSSRKLKTGGANLLAGRAVVYNLYPFTASELGNTFSLDSALNWGTLPILQRAQSDATRRKILQAYAHSYLREEIQQEQIVRKLEPFHRFLAVAAQMNGQIINFSAIARDCGVNERTVRTYFEILEDTLVGFLLQPFHESIRKRQRENPKFYFFDPGIVRALSQTLTVPVVSGSYEYGRMFESFIIHEIHRLARYQDLDWTLSYLRTKDGAEIDLILDRPGHPRALIEIKSAARVTPDDLTQLKRFLPEFKNVESYCLSNDPRPQRFGEIQAVPWKQGLKKLGLN